MNDFAENLIQPELQLSHFYIYFIFAAIVALFLIIKSDSKYKIELFFLSFFLITGNLNELLTIKIPGFSFFEIQPERFLFLMLLFFIFRKSLLSRKKLRLTFDRKVPWFEVALFVYVLMLTASQIVNSTEIGMENAIKTILEALAFLVIMVGLKLMANKPSYDLIGKSIIIGAVISSLVSLVQLSIDPYFLRIGDARVAFGDVLRSNGLFTAEYSNSYYLIIAIAWTLTTIKKNWLKISLIFLFTLGVLSTFHRMSWIILALVSVIYLVYIYKLAFEKILLIGLSCLALFLSLSIFYYQDFMNSTLVQERLTEPVDGRKGYYTIVLDNVDKKPFFGFGGYNNEVYYVNMLRITSSRDRATGVTGGFHSTYFSVLFLYGIPAFVCFVFFVLFSVFYYAKSGMENLYFVIPFLVSIIYLIGSLTNTFLFLSYLSVLFAIHIGIGMGIKKINKI